MHPSELPPIDLATDLRDAELTLAELEWITGGTDTTPVVDSNGNPVIPWDGPE